MYDLLTLQLKKHKGMTLIELMIVVIIIAVIAWLASTKGSDSVDDAKKAKAKSNLSVLCSSHLTYYLKNGSVTTDANLVSAGFIEVGDMWDGTSMNDPWNNAYTTTTASGKTTRELSAASQAIAGTNYSCSYP